jgi:hypothetical protein
MVTGALLLAAAIQAAIAPQNSSLRCSLANAAGDSVDFIAIAEGDDRLDLAPLPGSAWPVRAVSGRRAVGVRPENFARSAFAFGTARSGVLLHLGSAPQSQSWRVATLYGRDGSSAGLPLAYGICRQSEGMASASPQAAVLADEPVDTSNFDSRRWLGDDCALVTVAGLHTRFRVTIRSPENVEFASVDPSIWNGAPLAVERRVVRQLDGSSPGAATLSTASGLDGLEMTFVQFDLARAVELVQFRRLGGSGPAAAEPAFAICGHSFPARRHSS